MNNYKTGMLDMLHILLLKDKIDLDTYNLYLYKIDKTKNLTEKELYKLIVEI